MLSTVELVLHKEIYFNGTALDESLILEMGQKGPAQKLKFFLEVAVIFLSHLTQDKNPNCRGQMAFTKGC